MRLRGRGKGGHFLRKPPQINGEGPQQVGAPRDQPLHGFPLCTKGSATALHLQGQVAGTQAERVLQSHGAFLTRQPHGQAAAIGVAHDQSHAGGGQKVHVSVGYVRC